MKVLSHRGYWKAPAEKNSPTAFERSFSLGFGTETDVRDLKRELVISHDMPAGPEIRFAELLSWAAKASAQPLTLALNVKADGLAEAMARDLKDFPGLDCFVFDMSVPDMRAYFKSGIPVFTRVSEVERQPAWLELSAGVWLDAFESEWYGPSEIQGLLGAGKRVCVVSPELHGRPHQALWSMLSPLAGEPNLLLCTDLPEDAETFFFGGRAP
jgi:hypothetical protein